MNLSAYDYFVIVFYLIFMFSLGPVFKSFSKTASDYFRGGGSMLWWLVGCSSFMASFSAWAYTGGAAKAYETGTFFLLLYVCNISSLIFMFFFTAAKYRRMRIITAIEAVQKRYGKINEQIFTWLLIPSLLIFGGLSLYTIAVFVAGALGISMELIIITLGIVITGMTMLGGSWAATAGDFIQMLVVLAITILMAVLVLVNPDIGGMTGLLDKLPECHFDWTEFSRPAVLVFFGVTLLINQLILMNNMTAYGARYVFVKTGKDARKAVLVSIIGYLLLPPIWMIPAVAATYFHPDLTSQFPNLNNPNEGAYIATAMTLLPKGLVGLLISAVFAASVTSMNSQLNVSSGIFVRNFYIKVINRTATEGKQIFMGRMFMLVYGMLWILIAITFKALKGYDLFDLMLIVAASIMIPTAVPMFFGIFVKRTPSWSAWSTMVIGLIVSMTIRLTFDHAYLSALVNRFFELEVPLTAAELNNINVGLTTAVLFGVCIGWYFLTMLFYNPENQCYVEQVEHFFEEMHTPIDVQKEHGPEYENDNRQKNVIGILSLIYAAFIVLLVLIPNPVASRIQIAACGLFVGVFGLIVRLSAKQKSERVRPPDSSLSD